MIRSLFLFAILFLPSVCFSQSKEYIILKNTEDTLYGDVSYSHNFFKITRAAGGEVKYHSKEVAEVRSDRYKGNVIYYPLYQYNENFDDLSRDNFSSESYDTTLVLKDVYLTKRMNLYYTTDDYKTPYYFIQKNNDSTPTQLRILYRMNHGQTGEPFRHEVSRTWMVQHKIFIGQLKILMSDCYIDPAYWDALEYRSYSLKKIIKLYNKGCE